MITSNLHTHTLYCDGKDTPEQLVLQAIALGFDTIGFSGHVYTGFDESYCMSRENTARYKAEIGRLKQTYQGQIRVLCGIEQDYYAEASTAGYDFVIGSVHYVHKDGEYIPVDLSAEVLTSAINWHWGGDAYAFVAQYYALVAGVVHKTGADIIGHFDVVTKFNGTLRLFDQTDPRYTRAALQAADALLASGKLFEINTGAMARGLTTEPYPAYWLVDYIHAHGGKLTLSSDCHGRENLAYGFDEVERHMQAKGYPLWRFLGRE